MQGSDMRWVVSGQLVPARSPTQSWRLGLRPFFPPQLLLDVGHGVIERLVLVGFEEQGVAKLWVSLSTTATTAVAMVVAWGSAQVWDVKAPC